jgi:hypothetical protein
MSFIDFLTEAAAEAYEPITTEQLGILRQEVDSSALRIELNKKYIEKSDLNIALFNNDFYLSGVRLADVNVYVNTANGVKIMIPSDITFVSANRISISFNSSYSGYVIVKK